MLLLTGLLPDVQNNQSKRLVKSEMDEKSIKQGKHQHQLTIVNA